MKYSQSMCSGRLSLLTQPCLTDYSSRSDQFELSVRGTGRVLHGFNSFIPRRAEDVLSCGITDGHDDRIKVSVYLAQRSLLKPAGTLGNR